MALNNKRKRRINPSHYIINTFVIEHASFLSNAYASGVWIKHFHYYIQELSHFVYREGLLQQYRHICYFETQAHGTNPIHTSLYLTSLYLTSPIAMHASTQTLYNYINTCDK